MPLKKVHHLGHANLNTHTVVPESQIQLRRWLIGQRNASEIGGSMAGKLGWHMLLIALQWNFRVVQCLSLKDTFR